LLVIFASNLIIYPSRACDISVNLSRAFT